MTAYENDVAGFPEHTSRSVRNERRLRPADIDASAIRAFLGDSTTADLCDIVVAQLSAIRTFVSFSGGRISSKTSIVARRHAEEAADIPAHLTIRDEQAARMPDTSTALGRRDRASLELFFMRRPAAERAGRPGHGRRNLTGRMVRVREGQ